MARKVWWHCVLVFCARSIISCRKLHLSPFEHWPFSPTGSKYLFFFNATRFLRFLNTAPVSILPCLTNKQHKHKCKHTHTHQKQKQHTLVIAIGHKNTHLLHSLVHVTRQIGQNHVIRNVCILEPTFEWSCLSQNSDGSKPKAV